MTQEIKCYERGKEWGMISSQEIVGLFVEVVAFQRGLGGQGGFEHVGLGRAF